MTGKLAAIAVLIGLAGCASTGPGTATSTATPAPSGITAANGGGQRALGNLPNIGVTTGAGATAGPVLNSKGASY